jgi:hypothetical protein
MNLFELAHHPKAWDATDICRCKNPDFAWWNSVNSTKEQMDLLSPFEGSLCVRHHTDENEFRMHLLFVHWATAPDVEESNETS